MVGPSARRGPRTTPPARRRRLPPDRHRRRGLAAGARAARPAPRAARAARGPRCRASPRSASAARRPPGARCSALSPRGPRRAWPAPVAWGVPRSGRCAGRRCAPPAAQPRDRGRVGERSIASISVLGGVGLEARAPVDDVGEPVGGPQQVAAVVLASSAGQVKLGVGRAGDPRRNGGTSGWAWSSRGSNGRPRPSMTTASAISSPDGRALAAPAAGAERLDARRRAPQPGPVRPAAARSASPSEEKVSAARRADRLPPRQQLVDDPVGPEPPVLLLEAERQHQVARTPAPRPRRSPRGRRREPGPPPPGRGSRPPGTGSSPAGSRGRRGSGSVTSPQTRFSSGAAAKAASGPEKASTVEGGRVASGWASATRGTAARSGRR